MARESKSDIVKEAQERFQRCVDWESNAHARFKMDYRFANGDSYNKYQWQQQEWRNRDATQRPYLTVNKVRQHNLKITNDARQNKPSIKIKPTGNNATVESAKVYEGIIRHIEYRSDAPSIYDRAVGFQVQGGWGFWRVISQYEDDKSFNQELLIESIADPLSVYIDPAAKRVDKSDMGFAFIFEDVPTDKIETRYPEYKDTGTPKSTLGNTTNDWLTDKVVRVAEYYRVVEKKDLLVRSPNGDVMLKSEIPPELWKPEGGQAMSELPGVQTRPTITKEVQWFFIVGDEIKESAIWPGTIIPIVKVIGEETVIDGMMDCKGHTRSMIDPQRMYNWWSSSAVEYGALQTKTPWLVEMSSIEPYEEVWSKANTNNYAYLPYKSIIGEDGKPTPPPQRIEPPVAPPIAIAGMQAAAMEMQFASGQYEAQMGQQGNERTGVAIRSKQRQGDNATYHYIDNYSTAIRLTGRILLDVIPKIYDTERVITILGEDEETSDVKINPGQDQALVEDENASGEVIARSLNPKVGMYDVQADVGPGYATKREEAFESFTLMLTQAPQFAAIIGDILFRAADFPMADEAARRLKRMVPKEALGLGPSQAEQQLQAQVEQAQQLIASMTSEMGIMKAALERNKSKTDVDIYNAFTNRLKVLLDKETDEKEFKMGVANLLADLYFEPEAQKKAREAKIMGGSNGSK